jgi:8-oxo-dGTP pyrophosphatase MutT (NUDIX family)
LILKCRACFSQHGIFHFGSSVSVIIFIKAFVIMLVLKAMIYVTSPQGVLVFEEPESPHIGLQVPGGTIEQDEAPFLAARAFHSQVEST